MRAIDKSAAGIPICFQTLPADVREHWHSNRQRPAKSRHEVGPLVGKTVPPTLHRQANA